MKRMRIFLCLGLVFGWSVAGQTQQTRAEPALQTLKYAGLKDIVNKNRGQVVLVDFWGTFCPPCKAGFPKIVEMHNKYFKEGLAVVSVSLDEPANRESALKFLKKMNAEFTNIILDEPSDYWQSKFGFVGPPCYFVFNRQGQWTRFLAPEDGHIDYDAIEKFIMSCLREKK